MDDRRRENNKIKRSKSESVKSVVSVYLNKRQFPNIKPRRASKKVIWRRALLDNRISRCNSILYSSDPLVIEYSSMFEKFILWLTQAKYKHLGYDIEKLVGPIFCHLYFDIQSSGQFNKATTFFKTHIDKIDQSKCDETVKSILKAINNSSDIVTVNGTDSLNYEDLKIKFRSNKIVAELTPESLTLIKQFVTESCHIIFLHTFQTWFDLKTCSKIVQNNLNHVSKSIKSSEESNSKENSNTKEDEQGLKHKLENVINTVKKLPICICNVRLLNCKGLVTCGLIRRQLGIVAFAEVNILLVMPLKALDSVYGYDDIDNVKFNNHSRQIYCIALSPNNDIICTGSADHSICIYSLRKLKILKKIHGHLGPVYCIAISENSKYLISGSQDTTARLWSLNTGKMLRIFTGHIDAITSVNFHPNTLYVATGSADKNVRMWCLKTSHPVRLLHAAKKEVYAVAFDPNGLYLACASDDKLVRVWDISSSKVIYELKNRESSVTHLLWSKTSKQLCGATLSGVVKIWDLTNYQKEKEKNKDHKHTELVLRRRVHGRILHLDFTMGTWECLSVPKPGHSPLDNV